MRLWVPMPSWRPPPAAASPCSRSKRAAAASRSRVAQIAWSRRIGEYSYAGGRLWSCMLEIASASLRLDPRFNGPPGTANGGYACGAVGELVDGPAEVSLRMPPPLGVPLDVAFHEHGEVVVRHHGAAVAEARPGDAGDPPPPVRPSPPESRPA